MQTTTFNNQVRWAAFDAWTYSLDSSPCPWPYVWSGKWDYSLAIVIRLRVSCQGKLCQDSSFYFNNRESPIPLQFSFQSSFFYWSIVQLLWILKTRVFILCVTKDLLSMSVTQYNAIQFRLLRLNNCFVWLFVTLYFISTVYRGWPMGKIFFVELLKII